VREIGRSIEPFKHGTIALVAIAYTALALSNGGASQRLTAAATVAVWLAVAVGAAARAWSLRSVPRAAVLVGGCLAALGVLTGLSMLWADDSGRAFAAFVRVSGYVGLFTLVALCVPKSGVRPWLSGLAMGLTVVCLVSLGTRFDPSLFGNSDRSLGAVLANAQGRLSYPLGYWNGLAACLAIQAVLLFWFGARASTRVWRAVAVALIPLPTLGLYLTSSRGGFAAAVAGALVLSALERRRLVLIASIVLGAAGGALLIAFAHTRNAFLDGLADSTARHQGLEVGLAALLCVLVVGFIRYRLDARLADVRPPAVSWRIVAPLLITAAVVAVLLLDPESHVDQAPAGAGPGQGHLLSAGGSNRSQYWEAALDAFASKPVTGIGAGNFGLYWNAHPEVALPLINAHSLYLETLAELGILGLLFVLGFFAASAWAGWRARDAAGGEAAPALAVLGAGAVTAAIEWSFQIPAAFAPVIVVAGLLTAAPSSARIPAFGRASGAGPSNTFGLGIALIAIAWASIWAAGILLITDYKLDASRAAASRDDLAAAASDARDAAKVQPWSPEPRLQLALVDELGGDLTGARSAAGLAIERAPGDWRPWAVAARIDARAGHPQAAGIEILRAVSLSPTKLPNEFVEPVRQAIRKQSDKAPVPLGPGGGESRK
jgi:hypothetical protein